MPAPATVATFLGVLASIYGGMTVLFFAAVTGPGGMVWLLVPAAGIVGVTRLKARADWRLLAGAAGVGAVAAAGAVIEFLDAKDIEELVPSVVGLVVLLATGCSAAHRSTRTWVEAGRHPYG